MLRARTRAGQGSEDHRKVEESDGGAVAHAGQRLAEEEVALAGGGIPRAESDTAHRALKRELQFYCVMKLLSEVHFKNPSHSSG